ncbi:hypothetical protein HYH02_014120 [Chlamydomonas schloesseri]|uniref:Uncharacterized protein n=1 Tax=Chlamydomonas schloesseri TaxID=2026947 RepID=A0A835SL52_9CHLO|nr:hypothetical protein HYH02_014120 [Chlamydomonas schloesseri]|eukprot:KAG2429187.1 hypothetical protein HYH02_014120 [Chlamydomonas schloesseri]
MVEPASSPEQRMQPGASPSGRHHTEQTSSRGPAVTREGLATPPVSKPPVRRGSGAKLRESGDSISGALPPAALGSPAGGRGSALFAGGVTGRVGSTSVRFADPIPASALKRDGNQRDTTVSGGGAEQSDISGLQLPGAAPAPGPRISRVRLADDLGNDNDATSGAASETNVSMAGCQSRASSGTSVVGANKPDAAESRAVTQLASKLIARDINYRQEFEAIMETFGAVFPKSCLETFFETHSISLPNNRQLMILTLYQAGDNGDRIDGVSLLKDLDRAAFKRFAIASGRGPPGAEAGGKRSSITSVQRSDKSRILTLVSTQLNRDKSFSINAGGMGTGAIGFGSVGSPKRYGRVWAWHWDGIRRRLCLPSRVRNCGWCGRLRACTSRDELTDAQHIQELIEQIDLNNILIPIGTRAKYVPATDDPESFQVPVWSLRAMHKRKQERERFLIGNDPDFKKLGQTGRDALRKRLARRSMFQQQEIIANAVVAAARAAVEPSVRRVEHSIHSATASRMGSFQHSLSGSLTRGGSLDAHGGPMRPRSAAPPRAPGGASASGAFRPVSALPPRAPAASTLPGNWTLGAGVGVSPRGGLSVKPVTVAPVGPSVPPVMAAKRPSEPDATPLRPAPLLHGADKANTYGGADANNNTLHRNGGGIGVGIGRAPATPPHVAPRSPAHTTPFGHAGGGAAAAGAGAGNGHELDAAEAAIRRLAVKSFGRAPEPVDRSGAGHEGRQPLMGAAGASAAGAGAGAGAAAAAGGPPRNPRRSTDDNGISDFQGACNSTDVSDAGAAAAAAATAAVARTPGAHVPSVTSFSDRDASGLVPAEDGQSGAAHHLPHPDPPSPRLLYNAAVRSASGAARPAAQPTSSRPATSASGGSAAAHGRSPRPSSDAPLAGIAPPRPPSQDAAARSASGINKHLYAASRASGTGSGSGTLRGASADLSDDEGGELPGQMLAILAPAASAAAAATTPLRSQRSNIS